MSPKTVRTRILIISDTHCAPLTTPDGHSDPSISPPFKHPLPAADLLIHCGDLTYRGNQHEYHTTLDMLSHINAPIKLAIPGNHDLTLDKAFLLSRKRYSEAEALDLHTQARNLWTGPTSRAVVEGVTLLDEGTHTVHLANGAVVRVYASPYTPAFCDWGFPYQRDEDRFNEGVDALRDVKVVGEEKVPGDVDFMVTHGPPWGRLDQTARGDFAGCVSLLRAVMRVKPLVHCFGHIHEGWGVERVRFKEGVEQKAATVKEYKDGAWKEGVESVKAVEVDVEEAKKEHAVKLDLTTAEAKLVKGRDTLLVNASIMTERYRPSNAPWLLEMDLPVA